MGDALDILKNKYTCGKYFIEAQREEELEAQRQAEEATSEK